MSIIQQSYYPKYRYSLRGLLGPLYISPPEGWNEDDKVFKRSTSTHGIFTSLSNKLGFYIGDALNDGGYNYLKETYETYGINAQVLLVKEENVSGVFKELYRGYFDFSTYSREERKISIMFNESGLYEKIQARSTEDLELDRLTTMDGDIAQDIATETVALEGRRITIVSESNLRNIGLENSNSNEFYQDDDFYYTQLFMNTLSSDFYCTGYYGAIVLPLVMSVEQDGNSQTIYDYRCHINRSDGSLGNANSTANMFYDESPNAKDLKINLEIEFYLPEFIEYYIDTKKHPESVEILLVKYNGVLSLEIIETTVLFQVFPADTHVEKQYSFNLNEYIVPLIEGDSLSLICRINNRQHNPAVHPTNINGEVRFTKAILKTIDETYTEASSSKFILPFECLNKIIHVITNKDNKLKSKALGRTDIGYEEDGYASLTGLTNGFWVRQFNTNKITTNFQDFIDSFKAVWQIGYGIEKIGFEEIVRVEHMSYFYQNVVTIRLKNKPVNIVRKCAKEYFYSGIEIGYSQPSGTVLYEEVLGLDEYNILNNFTTAITKIKNKFTSVSKYRADSYGTEFARRKPKSKFPEEDTRYDLNVMILDLKRGLGNIFQQRKWVDDFVVPEIFNKETTGIHSPETATNLRFSPINTLLRWGFWLKGGLMKNLSEYIRYSSSNGNTKLITQSNEVGVLAYAENGNVLNNDLDNNLFNADLISFNYNVDDSLMNMLNESTEINGENIMNYYGLVEFVNEDNNYEYGFLMAAETNGNSKITLLSSPKYISKVIFDNKGRRVEDPTNLNIVTADSLPNNLSSNLNHDI